MGSSFIATSTLARRAHIQREKSCGTTQCVAQPCSTHRNISITMAIRVKYRRIPAGECVACLEHFVSIEVAELSCGHRLHSNCITALASRRCPLRCGQIRDTDIRPQRGGQAATAPGQQWGGEADRATIDFYRDMQREGNLDPESLALLTVVEANLLQREA
jgi:hypothetical protein